MRINPWILTNLAALILADAEVEITADKLNTILSEAGVEGLEPIWVDLFAKAVAKKDLNELLTAFNVGSAPAGAVAAAGGAAAASGDAAAEEEKVEEKEESDDDMGFGLFD
jgi:large subunit ribosomal protein LP1